MRRLAWGTLLAGLTASAMGLASCVGDDPGPPSTPTSSEAGTPDGTVPASTEAGVGCQVAPPQLFAPAAGMGPFCGPSLRHCAFGEHCCRDLALNTFECAATCPAGVADVACFNAAECDPAGGLVCCGKGTARLDVCTYAVVEGFESTSCAANCSNEFQACASTDECSGKVCTPARALTSDGKTTSGVQLGACL